jgi:Gpi18-like mannosyltransferase
MLAAHVQHPPPDRFRVNSLDRRIIAATLAIKIALLAFGVVVVALLGSGIRPDVDGVAADTRPLFEPWVRWDASNYLDLALFGYRAEDPGSLVDESGYRLTDHAELPRYIVFYPFYPWLVAAFDAVARDPSLAALLVSALASLFVGPVLFRLVAADLDAGVALRSVWFLMIFPTAYFLHIGYTESLFLGLSLGAMLAARRDHWWIAGVLGALATLTRVNGLILVPALAAEAALQWWPDRQWRRRWLAIGIVPLGFVVYLGLNMQVYGDPLAFVGIQATYWQKSLSPPWVGIGGLLTSGLPRAWIPELAFVALGVVGTIVSAARFRPSWTVWMAGNLLLVTSTSLVLSVPRYSLVFFPLFVWFAVLATSRRLMFAIAAISTVGLVFFAGRFALGLWAF